MSPIREGEGGVEPHTDKRNRVFALKKNLKKNTQHARRKTFFIKSIFLYCHPCLRTGSKEIFIQKKREKKSTEGVEGGGVKAKATCPLKNNSLHFCMFSLSNDGCPG